jgi:hypothetical protein
MKEKKIVGYLFCILILITSTIKVSASSHTFSFYPSSGVIENAQEGFTVDVLIDSGSYELNMARARIKFNPKVVKLVKASRNSSLFQQWPLEQSSTDNSNGVVILTGITDKDNEEGVPFYKTDTSPDVFCRLEFDVIAPKNEDIVISFEYTGKDQDLMSVLIDSNTQSNVLTIKPQSASFSLNSQDIPQTGISPSAMGAIVGILLILVGGYIRSNGSTYYRKRTGTIVLSD